MLRYSLLNITLWLFAVMAYGKGSELKVLQMNIWQEGTMVKGGFEAIADEVGRLEPDIVLFSEVRNYHGKQFISRILQALEERGKKYYGENSKLDVGILSKYKIEEQAPNCPLEDDAGSVLKARIRINGRDVVVYSAHLDYTHYACYLPRGYSGVTWKKLDAPVLDAVAIEKANNESMRDEAICHVIEDARNLKMPDLKMLTGRNTLIRLHIRALHSRLIMKECRCRNCRGHPMLTNGIVSTLFISCRTGN